MQWLMICVTARLNQFFLSFMYPVEVEILVIVKQMTDITAQMQQMNALMNACMNEWMSE